MPRLGNIRRHRVMMLAACGLCLPGIACAKGAVGAAQPASLFVSPTGSDSGPCSQSRPCASFDRAYHAATAGQTVQVMPGDYPQQSIRSDSSKTGPARVTFTAADPTQARVNGLRVSGNHLEFRRMTTNWSVLPGTTDVVFRGIISPGPITITGATHVSVIGGEVYSPVPVSSDSQVASIRGITPSDILIDGVSFHDFTDVGPGQLHHIECLQFGAGVNVTIRNSTFHNCGTHDIFIRSRGVGSDTPSPLSNILIENNWFGATVAGFYAMQIEDDLWTGTPGTSVVVRNNSALQSVLIRVSHGVAAVHGNILPGMSAFFCGSYGQKKWYDYNLYGSGVQCGAHDRIGDPRFADPAKLDLHLEAGSAALGHGDPASYPSSDIDGNLRPMHARPDAGASQRETAEIDIKKSIGAVSLGETKASVGSFYGQSRRTSRLRGSKGTAMALYRVHSGALWVLYNKAGVVVGVGTNSRYYNTATGLGVGVPTKKFASFKLRFGNCRGAYRRTAGSSGIYVTKSRAFQVTSLWVLHRTLGVCPKLPG